MVISGEAPFISPDRKPRRPEYVIHPRAREDPAAPEIAILAGIPADTGMNGRLKIV